MSGDAEENAARNTLADMQARLAAGPFAVLAIPPTSTPEETRSAFLQLTKQFHPARFGRMATDVQRLANEVFLGIKAAHDSLAKAGGWSPRGQPNHAPQAPAAIAGPASGSVRTTGARPSQPAPNTPATGVRISGSSSQPPTQPLPVARSAGVPQQPASRQTTQPLHRTATQPVPVVGRVATGPAVGGSRPSTPSAAPAPQPAARPTTPSPAPQSQAASRSGPATLQPKSTAASGPARAPTNTAPAPTVAGGAPFDERAAMMQVQDLVRKGQWAAARQALQNLASRVPSSTQYKALLAYARGREAQQLGRNDEATLEFQRALQLDPNLSLAKSALAEMQSRHK